MRKLFSLSLYIIMGFFLNMLLGCNEPNDSPTNSIPDKTYEEFYNDLGNTTIEMEVVIKDKRATFFYSNDQEFFVSSIKYENAQEFGFVYNKLDNILYTIDKGQITKQVTSSMAQVQITNIFKTANYLFHLKLNKDKFVFQETVTIADRECSKFRYEDTSKNQVYNIYLDNETSLCLKCVCSNINTNTTEFFFETKKYTQEPNVTNYKDLIFSYTNNNDNKNEKNNTE